MLHSIFAYLKFIISSKNQYGVHSPFIYDYFTKGLLNDSPRTIGSMIDYRKKLIKNKALIEVTDYGAGSRVFKDKFRVVSKIATKAGISKKRGLLLYKTIRYFKPQQILEIGTSLGMASAYMAYANPKASIVTIEGCPNISAIAKVYFEKYALDNIQIKTGEFGKVLPSVFSNKIFDFIYFDGNHQKEPTLTYFKMGLNNRTDNSIFIFDDIHLNKEMEEAWEFIKNHKDVTLTIDSFKWGMVLFRKGQVKEHFVLRL